MSNSRRWMEDLSREVHKTAENSLSVRDFAPVIDTLELLGLKVAGSEGTSKEIRAELDALGDRVGALEGTINEVVERLSEIYSVVEVLAGRGTKS